MTRPPPSTRLRPSAWSPPRAKQLRTRATPLMSINLEIVEQLRQLGLGERLLTKTAQLAAFASDGLTTSTSTRAVRAGL